MPQNVVHLGQFHGARSWDENVNQMAAKDCEGIFEEWVVGKGVVELWGVAGGFVRPGRTHTHGCLRSHATYLTPHTLVHGHYSM